MCGDLPVVSAGVLLNLVDGGRLPLDCPGLHMVVVHPA